MGWSIYSPVMSLLLVKHIIVYKSYSDIFKLGPWTALGGATKKSKSVLSTIQGLGARPYTTLIRPFPRTPWSDRCATQEKLLPKRPLIRLSCDPKVSCDFRATQKFALSNRMQIKCVRSRRKRKRIYIFGVNLVQNRYENLTFFTCKYQLSQSKYKL